MKEELKRKEKGFEDKMSLANNNNKQLMDANVKLKADLKKATDELNDLKGQMEKYRGDINAAKESQTVILLLKKKEEEYQQQMLVLASRVRSLEEELQSRIIDGEDVH